MWLTNANSKSCSTGGYLYHNQVPTNAGTLIAGPFTVTVPANTTTPTKYTATLSVPATSLIASDQLAWVMNVRTNTGSCSGMSFYFGATIYPTKLSLPSLTGGGSPLAQPATPTWVGSGVVANADGTRTLTWTDAGGSAAADFYRIYRDGQNYTARVDTQGVTGASPVTWTDTNTGGSSHTYRVTAVSASLAESDQTSPATG
jgi:hypothetical protein